MLKIQQIYKKTIRRYKYYFLWYVQCLISKSPIFSFSLDDGSQFDYPLRSAVGRTLFSGVFEAEEMAFVRQILKPRDIFFDVGANGGLYTIIAAKQVGENGHVYAFEPGERELKLLRHNIAINRLTNVTIVESAVSNIKSEAKFAISVDGAMNSLIETNHPLQKIQEWQTVNVTTLDDIIQDLSLRKVDFIKIDVEGAEKQVFEGAKSLLKSQKEIVILFEAGGLSVDGFECSVEDVLQQVMSFGFFVYYIDRSGSLINISANTLQRDKKVYNFIASKMPL